MMNERTLCRLCRFLYRGLVPHGVPQHSRQSRLGPVSWERVASVALAGRRASTCISVAAPIWRHGHLTVCCTVVLVPPPACAALQAARPPPRQGTPADAVPLPPHFCLGLPCSLPPLRGRMKRSPFIGMLLNRARAAKQGPAAAPSASCASPGSFHGPLRPLRAAGLAAHLLVLRRAQPPPALPLRAVSAAPWFGSAPSARPLLGTVQCRSLATASGGEVPVPAPAADEGSAGAVLPPLPEGLRPSWLAFLKRLHARGYFESAAPR